MARPRFEKTDPARQEAILQAAAKEFAKVGYEAASVNRILESAGLSKGAFYYYFDDKADLAATVLAWAYKDLFEMYGRLRVPDDPAQFWDFIREFMRESLALFERSPFSNELMARLGQAFANDKELAARVVEIAGKAIGSLGNYWKRGQELGAVRSDIPVEILLSLLQGIKETLIRAYLPEGHVPSHEDLQRLAELQLDLYRRISTPAPEGPR